MIGGPAIGGVEKRTGRAEAVDAGARIEGAHRIVFVDLAGNVQTLELRQRLFAERERPFRNDAGDAAALVKRRIGGTDRPAVGNAIRKTKGSKAAVALVLAGVFEQDRRIGIVRRARRRHAEEQTVEPLGNRRPEADRHGVFEQQARLAERGEHDLREALRRGRAIVAGHLGQEKLRRAEAGIQFIAVGDHVDGRTRLPVEAGRRPGQDRPLAAVEIDRLLARDQTQHREAPARQRARRGFAQAGGIGFEGTLESVEHDEARKQVRIAGAPAREERPPQPRAPLRRRRRDGRSGRNGRAADRGQRRRNVEQAPAINGIDASCAEIGRRLLDDRGDLGRRQRDILVEAVMGNQRNGAGHMRCGHRGARRPGKLLSRNVGQDIVAGRHDEEVGDPLAGRTSVSHRDAGIAGPVRKARDPVVGIDAADNQQMREIGACRSVVTHESRIGAVIAGGADDDEIVLVAGKERQLAIHEDDAVGRRPVAHVDGLDIGTAHILLPDAVERGARTVIRHPPAVVEDGIIVDIGTRRDADDADTVGAAAGDARDMRAVEVERRVGAGIEDVVGGLAGQIDMMAVGQ